MSDRPSREQRQSGWLPAGFEHPRRVPLPCGLHLRPIRATDLDLHLVAVQGSQPRLWARFGQAWGWPPATLTADQDYADLHRHEQESRRQESFAYALADRGGSALLGCVYLDPDATGSSDSSSRSDSSDSPTTGAEVSWWVVEDLVGTPVEAELDAFVPAWLASRWPFDTVRYAFGSVPAPAGGRRFSFDGTRTPLPEADQESATTLWRRYEGTAPTLRGTAVPSVSAFGDSVELADELYGLVSRGVKTATASLLGDYDEDEPVPEQGDHWVVTDGDGRAGLVLQTTEVRTGPLAGVTRAFAWDEGEGDRSRESWTAGHEAFWARTSAARGASLDPGDEVVFERFRVVWPPAAVARGAAFRRSAAAEPPAAAS